MLEIVVFPENLIDWIERGRNEDAQSMINEVLAKASDVWGSLLHYCAISNNKVIARYLLELGGDVDAVSLDSKTPLFIAVEQGHPEVVEVLLQAGANFDRAVGHRKSVLETAFDVRYMQRQVIQRLISRVRSTSHNDELFIERLVRAGCDLHRAAMSGHVELVKIMLKHPNANVNSASHGGCTALLVAAEENDAEIVRILIDNGADCNIVDNNERNDITIRSVIE